eukprot:287040_1
MQVIRYAMQQFNALSTPKKATACIGSMFVSFCVAKIYSKRDKIVTTILMNLPETIRFALFKKVLGLGNVIDADIYPFALWMVYKIEPDKMDQIQDLLPSGFTPMPHKIYVADVKPDYYLCHNIYMSKVKGDESIRLEINVIARNTANKACWVIVDYYTDGMRFDPIAPFGRPNACKKYFNVTLLQSATLHTKRQIEAGIYINNQEKRHDLFDFKVEVDLTSQPLEMVNDWIRANDVMYFGGKDTNKLDESGYVTTAEFDEKEHENYLKANVKHAVNNMFTAVRGELVTCFVIPNRQRYKLKI